MSDDGPGFNTQSSGTGTGTGTGIGLKNMRA
ncbi:signal transduction histidine kinase [Xanthomonas sacchari]|nr:signal transduction histidine kinase [Xanthomonas sp. F10]